MTILFAGESPPYYFPFIYTDLFLNLRGGTSGCVVAGRLAENPHVRILVIEAGPHHKDLENVHMVGGFVICLEVV